MKKLLLVLLLTGCASHEILPDYEQNDLIYFNGDWYHVVTPLIHVQTNFYEELEK